MVYRNNTVVSWLIQSQLITLNNNISQLKLIQVLANCNTHTYSVHVHVELLEYTMYIIHINMCIHK